MMFAVDDWFREDDDALLAAVGAMDAAVSPAPAIDTAALARAAYDWRALTVKQPWAACIATGQKRVENRTWQTRHRDPLLIHAGAEWDKNATRLALDPHAAPVMSTYYGAPAELSGVSAILAVAMIDDCHPYEPGCCASVWAEKTPSAWHWVLGSVRALPVPVPCKGSLSLWRPPQDVLDAVLKQLGGAS